MRIVLPSQRRPRGVLRLLALIALVSIATSETTAMTAGASITTAPLTPARAADAGQPVPAAATPSAATSPEPAPSAARLESARLERLRRDVAADASGRTAALAAFWAEIAATGAPLVEPIDEKRAHVTFLWRDTSDTRSVRLFWPVFQERPGDDDLRRLAETDVWFKTTTMPRGTRVSYQFAPNVPVGEQTREARRRAILAVAQPDPLNPRRWPDRADTDRAEVSSVLELPGAPAQPWNHAPAAGTAALVSTHRVASAVLGNERDVTIAVPPNLSRTGTPAALVILFDREPHLDHAQAPDAIANLVAAGRIPPTVAVFVGHPTRESRGTELPPNPAFAQFVATELVPWVRARYHVTDDPQQTIVGGVSYGGLAAAYVALTYPERFGNVLSQSGSFWWSPARDPARPQQADALAEPNWMAAEAARRPHVPVRFYLNAGLFEEHSDILPMTRHLRDVLVARGYDVAYDEFAGGHDWLAWRAGLADGLLHLLATDRVATRAR